MGIFSGANKQDKLIGGKRKRLSDYDGSFKLKCVEVRASDEQQIYFAIDWEIMESSNPGLKAGEVVGWYTERHAKFPAYFFSDIKRVLGALGGVDPLAVTEEDMEQAKSEAQPCKGLVVRAEVSRSSNVDKNGKAYGDVSYEPVAQAA